MIFQIFNLFFGLIAFILSLRYEVGVFNYLFGINYSVLSLFAIEIARISLYELGDWDGIVKYDRYLMFMLLVLTLYNNLILLSFNKPLLIFIYRSVVVGFIVLIGIMNELQLLALTIVFVNSILILVIRAIHFDEFKYGTIHPRYAYITFLLYLLIGAELILEQFLKKDLYIYYLCLPLAFVYNFQLNLYYNAIRLGYSTFFRSGALSRALLIIDYYEIPDTKI